jgi:hypothetical protein
MAFCTECGRSGARLKRVDAADHVHWFHSSCWKELCAWLAGKPVGQHTTAMMIRKGSAQP